MKILRTLRLAALMLGIVSTLTLSAKAQTSDWAIDSAHSGIQFEIRHFGVSNVRGSFSKITGTVKLDDKDVTKSSVQATIPTSTVNTNEDKRDGHLKGGEFFNVEKYPTMTFKSTSIKRVNGKLQMSGDLTLVGVTKPVILEVDGPAAPQKGMGGKMLSGLSASGVIKRSDFGFGSKYGPPMLGDEVKFTIDIEMTK